MDLSRPHDLSIHLDPGGAQPSFFADSPAVAEDLRLGDFVGSVHRGGSCNAQLLRFAPHCHGTHTECVGHLMAQPMDVLSTIETRPCPARLATVRQERIHGTPELTLEAIRSAVAEADHATALIIRTLPNSPDKRYRDYAAEPAYPVIAEDGMRWLRDGPWVHLLIDTPSLDPASDGGRLLNHRLWWGLDDRGPGHASQRSVTEMIYVPDEVPDGDYWLDLQLQPLVADAVASRPVIYPVISP
ncbi:MAG: cyclase family protein [Xanthomonadales bacterium]|nr:cyclase family protein [Xanthomonadales bacterium]